MSGQINPKEQFDMSVDEFLSEYVDQLEEKHEQVEVEDDREKDGFFKVEFSDGGPMEEIALLILGDEIFPFDFTSREARLALDIKN